eukprot:gb/GECG01001768.1/.p1 GENE.gb/GECG01001768.1/~~gb/GECG01001768.1/.p1  ORF type:complete len:105 (+),score=6.58 gb/GECG01001768.1/:1-315(+)
MTLSDCIHRDTKQHAGCKYHWLQSACRVDSVSLNKQLKKFHDMYASAYRGTVFVHVKQRRSRFLLSLAGVQRDETPVVVGLYTWYNPCLKAGITSQYFQQVSHL